MQRSILLLTIIATVLFLIVTPLSPAQAPAGKGSLLSPPSSLGIPGVPRTPLFIFVSEEGPQPTIPSGETPASIACIYGVTQKTPGCPQNGTVLPSGGTNAIAVIEWGKNSTMKNDLKNFSSTFGLPAPNVTEVCADSSCPSNDQSGWDVETALDVQWAHAMAPNAQLFVVEGSNDLWNAEVKAGQLVSAAGGGEISNSWVTSTSSEDPNEKQWDKYFKTPTIVYFAASGDWGGHALYPSASPFVVSAGGTTVERSNGKFTGESCWSSSGGGLSKYEPRPSYQKVIKKIVGSHRGTPDMSAVADPYSGVAVYNSTYCGGWCVVGGTSAASPILAGIVNAAGSFMGTTKAELTKVYTEYGDKTEYKKLFRDITTGSNGNQAKKGWDMCTGVGSPKNLSGE